jgi:hypothetical protein
MTNESSIKTTAKKVAPLCKDCAHYQFIQKVFDRGYNPTGSSHEEHRCHALNGTAHPVFGGMIQFCECSEMRFGSACEMEGKLYKRKEI